VTTKLGLALGSGGARGWAHIGIIRTLQEANVDVHYVAGTSIGAFVGAIYAGGGLDDLELFARAIDWKTIVSLCDLDFPTCGLLDGDRVYDLIGDHIVGEAIEELALPFRCVATDLGGKRAVILQRGSVVDAVRASISMPGVFTPFQRDAGYLIDGGVVDPVPVDVVAAMGSDVTLAVNLNASPSPQIRAAERALTNCTDTDSSEGNTSGSNGDRDSDSGDRPEWLEAVQSRYESVRETLKDKLDRWLPERPLATPDSASDLNIFDVIGNAINIMEQQVAMANLQIHRPDLLLEPDLSDFGIFDFHRADDLIAAGRDCARERLPELRDLLASQTETAERTD